MTLIEQAKRLKESGVKIKGPGVPYKPSSEIWRRWARKHPKYFPTLGRAMRLARGRPVSPAKNGVAQPCRGN